MKALKIVTIVGARPQFIKAAPVGWAFREAGHTEFLLHTGQHYDENMSRVFFEELGIKSPDINLGVGSGSHGEQTGKMLHGIEEVLLVENPDWVVVFGDTNSTLAGALAAVKLHIPVAHVEAGLRSFNRMMPEEHNRVLTDHCSDLLFCPTEISVKNLRKEGITKGVHLVGDTMYDAVLHFGEILRERSTVMERLDLEPGGYLLATLHRPSNVDNGDNLREILQAFLDIGKPVIFPVHPRTRERINKLDPAFKKALSTSRLKMIDPVGYLDMLMLEKHAATILTDSGGIQKEAYFFEVPCVTIRTETEWLETVAGGWNVVVGTDRSLIVAEALNKNRQRSQENFYGDGNASKKILQALQNACRKGEIT